MKMSRFNLKVYVQGFELCTLIKNTLFYTNLILGDDLNKPLALLHKLPLKSH